MKSSQKLAFAVALAIGAYSTSASADLLLQYGFDEAASGNTPALDGGIAPAANATFGGTSTRTSITPAGLSVGALDTNGGAGSSYLTAGDAAKLDGLNQVTVSAWINLQAAPGQYDRLLSDHDTNGGWELTIDNPLSGTRSAANFRLSFGVDLATSGFSANLSADNTWLFVAATYDGLKTSGNLNYYTGTVDAAVAVSGLANQTLDKGPTLANTADFRIGSTVRTTNDRNPDAFIDDVRVYNEVLTLAQLDSVRMTSVPEPAMLGMALLASLGLLRRSRR